MNTPVDWRRRLPMRVLIHALLTVFLGRSWPTAAHAQTNPKDLATMADPIGPENDTYLQWLASEHDLIVLAWGANADPQLARQVTSMLWRALSATGGSLGVLGWTDGDQPRHPLYLRADTPLQCLTAGAHPDYIDVDPRWVQLISDTADLDVDNTAISVRTSTSRRSA